MDKLALITGGTSGIGKALVKTLIETYKVRVIVIGRNESALQELQDQYHDYVIPIKIDLSEPINLNIKNITDQKINYFVHAATILDPIGDTLDANVEKFLTVLKTNLLSVYQLVQLTLPNMGEGARILNISSRVAQSPIREFGMHCVSKAATESLIKTFKLELNPSGILLNSIYPGVVDTPAQQRVRGLPIEKYPVVKSFIDYKEQGKILTPTQSANFIADVLINSNDTDFQENFWSFYDSKHWQDIGR